MSMYEEPHIRLRKSNNSQLYQGTDVGLFRSGLVAARLTRGEVALKVIRLWVMKYL